MIYFSAGQCVCTHSKNDSKFLQMKGINDLDWSAMSWDLNPIGHIHVGYEQGVHSHQPQNPQELGRALFDEWQNIPQRTICSVCQSVARTLPILFINANNGHTLY